MSDLVNLSFKIPTNIYKKFKVVSVLTGKSMPDMIAEYVKKLKVPSMNFDEVSKTRKPATATAPADNLELKEKALELKADGGSLSEIAAGLDKAGFLTTKGGSWHKSTVGNLIKGWLEEADPDAEAHEAAD